jgi:uncharacterized protein YyaL (SSP411 family)
LELFQATGDPAWLEWAVTLQQRHDELFWDDTDGGWFSTTGHDPSVLLRMKEEYDGAEPAASSVSVLNLLTLSSLGVGSEDGSYEQKVAKTFGMFANNAAMRGRAVPMMLAALSTYHSGTPQIVIVGRRNDPAAVALHAEVRRHYRPTAIVVPVTDPALAAQLPWVARLTRTDGRATAYVCRDFACELPATTPEELARALSR